MMANSGARGSNNQIKQLAGMRGLMANTSGETMEIPIKSNFREGLDVLEYFASSHGTRKGLADTALRTADSGYLTRRLVDISQDVIVREIDCGTTDGIWIKDIKDGKSTIVNLEERLIGRYLVDDALHPETGEVVMEKMKLIKGNDIKRILAAGIREVKIRSVLTCTLKNGVCAKCYGSNLASNDEEVNVGEAVGIIAAQSIGEPGTQLTMRTFHTGGIAGNDITQGLPRVEELFEARKPKGDAIISDIPGSVSIRENKKKKEVVIENSEDKPKAYLIPFGSRLIVSEGDVIKAGDQITEGSVNPNDILKIQGVDAVQDYLIKEVHKVYRLQGVDINDRHIEVIVRQMLRKAKIDEPGDTDYLFGTQVDYYKLKEENKALIDNGMEPAKATRSLLGITKASLATDSFLSAASFQETTRVLTEAAIKGKIDPLVGLKENVIIGKLIPAGTGMTRYKGINVVNTQESVLDDIIDFQDIDIEGDEELDID